MPVLTPGSVTVSYYEYVNLWSSTASLLADSITAFHDSALAQPITSAENALARIADSLEAARASSLDRAAAAMAAGSPGLAAAYNDQANYFEGVRATAANDSLSAQARLTALTDQLSDATRASRAVSEYLGPLGDAAALAAACASGDMSKVAAACAGILLAAALGALAAALAIPAAPAAVVIAVIGLLFGLTKADEWVGEWVTEFGAWYGRAVRDLEEELGVAEFFDRARNWMPRRDPLTLDLDGDGIETVAALGQILFDHDGDGIRGGTGWVAPDDGFLVLDRNGNGTIDNGSELFGADTLLSNGTRATSGFQALSDQDSNQDGVFNASDAQFANVRVWRDLNQDGISQANELFTLDALGIQSINLTPTDGVDVNLGNGNVITNSGVYTRTDGSTALAGDLELAVNAFYRVFTPEAGVVTITQEASELPNVSGSGAVRDLQEAASINPELAQLINAIAPGTSRTNMMAQMDAILAAWGGTSAMLTSEQYLEGILNPGNQLLVHWPLTQEILDQGIYAVYANIVTQSAQLLPIIGLLERFTGQSFFGYDLTRPTAPAAVTGGNTHFANAYYLSESNGSGGTNYVYFPGITVQLSQDQINFLYESLHALRESVYYDLVLSTRLSNYQELIELTFDTAADTVSWNYSLLNAELLGDATGDSVIALEDLYDLQRSSAHLFPGWNWDDVLVEMASVADFSTNFMNRATSLFGATARNGLLMPNGTIGNDLILGDVGNDVLSGGEGDDILFGGTGTDNLVGNNGDDSLYGGSGNDTLEGGEGNDLLEGGAGDDMLVGGGSYTTHDVLRGGAGNDTLVVYGSGRFGGANILEGGTGNDTLTGSFYGDRYIFNLGDGQDIINDSFGNGNAHGFQDSIEFGAGIDPSDVIYTRVGNDLVFSIANSTDQITVTGWFTHANNWIERIQFADGSSWTAQQVTYDIVLGGTAADQTLNVVDGSIAGIHGGGGNDTITGNTGHDILFGDAGNDIINGGAGGSDIIEGGDGDDILNGGGISEYTNHDILRGGAGNDTLIAGQSGYYTANVLEGGTGNDNVTGGFYGDRYVFNLGDGQDIINDWFGNGHDARFQDRIEFGAGINPADVSVSRVGNDLLISIANSTDQITVTGWFTHANNWIESIQFADGSSWTAQQITYEMVLGGTAADQNLDVIAGSTAGIHGGGGSDTIMGGTGNDSLFGDAGNDIVHGGAGGSDILEGGDGDDVLNGGVISDYANHDVLRGGAGNDTLISGGGGYYTANVLEGGTGNDTSTGSSFGDRFVFNLGDGQDTINDNGGNGDNVRYQDRIELGAGINPADVSVSRVGNDLLLSIANSTDSITVTGWFSHSNNWIESIQFADGSSWSAQQITYEMVLGGTAADQNLDVVAGSTAAIHGGGGSDTITGSTGNDSLFGDAGNDIVHGGAGGSDILEGGDGDDVLNGGVISDYNHHDQLRGGAGNDTLISGGGGYYTANVLEGGTGNDTSTGSSFGDRFVFNLGDGQDTIIDTGGNGQFARYQDRIEFGAGINPADVTVTRVGNDLLLSVANSTDQITVAGWFTNSNNWIEHIQFADGSSWTAQQVTYDMAFGATNADQVISVVAGSTAVLHGGGGNDTMTGNSGHDTLYGDAGNDIIDGNTGSDILEGGDGDDTLHGGASTQYTEFDILRGGAGNDVLMAGAGGYYTANVLEGGTGNDNITGGFYGDRYIFNLGDGQDTINDGFGNGENVRYQDRIEFGAGINPADVTVSRVGNNLVLSIANSTDSITVAGWFTNANNWVERVEFTDGTIWSAIDINANALLIGDATNQTLSAVGNVNAFINAGEGNDTLVGASGADRLNGDAGDDIISGGAGSDQLNGGIGNDTMNGGLGNDSYMVDAIGDVVTELLGEGTDTVSSSIAYTLGNNVENLTLTGTSAINATGNGLDNVLVGNSAVNTLTGGAGNDILDGGAGIDTMIGGTGNDTYIVEVAGEVVTEASNAGTDSVLSSVTYTLGSNVENLTLTGIAAINATGNTLANTLVGNSAANTLSGGTGADNMSGGLGDDVYVVDNVADVVIEQANAGTDRVQSSITYTLGNDLENLTLTGSAAINGNGNSLNNSIIGNTGSNTLTGGEGNDTLNGGTGNDTMLGGTGNDTYVVDAIGDVITELSSEGTDLVQSSVTYTLAGNIENMTLTGTTAINATGNTLDNVLTGNSANNTLTGGAGNDTLNGGTGNDTMIGGAGNDIFVVNVTGDVVNEASNEGTDTVQSAITYTLGANVENLTLTGTTAINGTGNTLDNMLVGNSANNTLTGGGGNDTLDGGTGNDTMVGGAGNDTFVVNVTGDVVTEAANEGTDTVQSAITYTLGSNVENLTLTGTTAVNGTGNALNNVMTGNSANNTLSGGAGNDTLNGGQGNDTLIGGAGVNQLYGNEGNDILSSDAAATGGSAYEGGTGNDTITGGQQNDTYRFNIGDGQDTITDNGQAGFTDIISFGTGITSSMLQFTRVGNNLLISVNGSADTITVNSWYAATANQIEQISFANGTSLDASQIQTLTSGLTLRAASATASVEDLAIATATTSSLPESLMAGLLNEHRFSSQALRDQIQTLNNLVRPGQTGNGGSAHGSEVAPATAGGHARGAELLEARLRRQLERQAAGDFAPNRQRFQEQELGLLIESMSQFGNHNTAVDTNLKPNDHQIQPVVIVTVPGI